MLRGRLARLRIDGHAADRIADDGVQRGRLPASRTAGAAHRTVRVMMIVRHVAFLEIPVRE